MYQKIAIIKLSALGDIIHASIVLQFIKKHSPNSHITWIVDEKFSQILELANEVDEIVSLPLKEKKFKKSYEILRNLGKFDKVIDLQGLIKSAIITKILGKNSFGFDKNSIKEPLASIFYKHKLNINYNENIIIRNLALVSFALNFKFELSEILNKKPCFQALDSKNQELDKDKKNILIAPFSSEKSKNYTKFDEVIRLLLSQNLNVLISFGSEKEFQKAEFLAQKTGANLIKKQGLKMLPGLIKNCDLVIGNDSGVTHLAWALNVPSITIFGNRPSQRNTFKTSINLTIDAGKKIDAKRIDKNDFCINEISPKDIYKLAKDLIL